MGQRWGKKNGPPYPLGSSDHSASERKAGWRSSLKKDKKNKSKTQTIYKDPYGNVWKIEGKPSKETQAKMDSYNAKKNFKDLKSSLEASNKGSYTAYSGKGQRNKGA